MRDNNIDMWIVMSREGNFDPLYPNMGKGYVGKNGYYIFTDPGEGRIERAALGVGGYFLKEGGAYDHFGAEEELKSYVEDRDPQRIGLNISKSIGGADGLSHSGYLELEEILGETYAERFVSAEKLVSDFRSQRVASEIAAFSEACELSYTIAEKAMSNAVIKIIERGDVLMLDFGVGLMNMYTDMKRIAYVLRRETRVPDGTIN